LRPLWLPIPTTPPDTDENHDLFSGSGSQYIIGKAVLDF